MEDVNVHEELRKAHKELADLLLKREQTEIEIARQKRRVAAWAELCEQSDFAEPQIQNYAAVRAGMDLGGLTDACRTALRGSRKEWMTTAEIQLALKELGFPLQDYKAPAASITTTVNRLVEGGEVIASPRTTPGATEYKWLGKTHIFNEYGPWADAVREAQAARPDTVEDSLTEAMGSAESFENAHQRAERKKK
jgi:hypothetical protein